MAFDFGKVEFMMKQSSDIMDRGSVLPSDFLRVSL